MNSLEFIKQHVTEWPNDKCHELLVKPNGWCTFYGNSWAQCLDLSEHFAPSYYDGKAWTREEFEACGVVETQLDDGKKYETTIIGLCGTAVKIDIYRVLDAYPQVDPHIEHLIKKALKPGGRGHKDKRTDYLNIIESAQKALILLDQKERLSDVK